MPLAVRHSFCLLSEAGKQVLGVLIILRRLMFVDFRQADKQMHTLLPMTEKYTFYSHVCTYRKLINKILNSLGC